MIPSIDIDRALALADAASFDSAASDIAAAQRLLEGRSGPGSDFLGWLDLPLHARDDVPRLLAEAARLREIADVLVVVGIGGSYLGARAVIEACAPPFAHPGLDILYAGHHISGRYLEGLLRHLEGKRVAVNVISKSGTTTEPALAFRIIARWLEERVGREEAARRIVATTDASRGALRGLAEREGYARYVIPDDVGGRFSVFTPVGLLPIAAAGIDIAALLEGAAAMRDCARRTQPAENPAVMYAALRTMLLRSGKTVEILASFEPALVFIAEWWKQLYGESEGKDGKGVFPASVIDSTDLHSMGQYIQDGPRMLFETFLTTRSDGSDLRVPHLDGDADGLNYLEGKDFGFVNRMAHLGTAEAHQEGGVPSSTISLDDLSPRSIGALLYFFEYAVALSGYALGVNPFDQPGVEAYKRNMFRLLGKPGPSA